MTYEEASAEWVRQNYHETGEITDVEFSNGSETSTGCPTCGPDTYNYTEVSYRIGGYSKFHELYNIELSQIIRELVEIASAQLP